jgi:uncharacterized phage-associated protein
MSYMKLLKLLYLTDRESLLRWGRPLSTDVHVSMDHGPVLSQTLDLIYEGPNGEQGVFWARYISAPANYEVTLKEKAPNDELSRAEEKLIASIFEKFGQISRWQIRDYVHTLPEWIDPYGSAIPIHYGSILRAGGKTDEEIEAVLGELRGIQHLQSCLAS